MILFGCVCSDVSYDEQRLSLIRRIDFAWAVEKDAKKQKTAKDKSTPWPWQSMLENLQLAREELSVIIDLIDTVRHLDNLLPFLLLFKEKN